MHKIIYTFRLSSSHLYSAITGVMTRKPTQTKRQILTETDIVAELTVRTQRTQVSWSVGVVHLDQLRSSRVCWPPGRLGAVRRGHIAESGRLSAFTRVLIQSMQTRFLHDSFTTHRNCWSTPCSCVARHM